MGAVVQVNGDDIEISDPRDPNFFRVPAKVTWLEGSRASFRRYFTAKHPGVSGRVWQEVLGTDSKETKPRESLRRVRQLLRSMSQQSINLTDGLSVTVGSLVATGTSILSTSWLRQTEFVFDYASKTTDTLASRGLRRHGPYDKTQPPFKEARFLIVCPKPYEPDARTFFGKFEQGCIYPNRQKQYYDFPGFSNFVRAGRSQIEFAVFDPKAKNSIGASYEYALEGALRRLGADINLCFVMTEDAHKELPLEDDPYCIAKGMLFGHGIPVSELTVEEARADKYRLPFILSGMALQAYAKMGGVPFVIKADPDDRTELILGVGRADVGASRFGKKRVVGFATVFKSNGDYLVGNVQPFKDPDNYGAELSQVIEEGLREAIEREGVEPGTPLRLIFHNYKKSGGYTEVAAVEAAIQKLTDYSLEYAFVHISDTHGWLAVDEDDQHGIAPRALRLRLGPSSCLVNIIGPREYLGKGTPGLLKVSIDRRSTYRDLDRISQQVFDFANVSWRGFNIIIRPVTIQYAHLAAELAGKLGQTKYWQPSMLKTFLRDKKWFL